MNSNYFLTKSSFLGLIACLAFTGSACSQSTTPTHDDKAPPIPENAKVFDFENGDPGNVPPGFTTGLTGGGGAVRWEIDLPLAGHWHDQVA